MFRGTQDRGTIEGVLKSPCEGEQDGTSPNMRRNMTGERLISQVSNHYVIFYWVVVGCVVRCVPLSLRGFLA